MIRLKSLLSENKQLPDPALGQFLLANKVEIFSDWVYHGSPLEGLKSMLTDGVYGSQHGELSEYEAFSTSINSEVLEMFSDGEGETGLQFKVENMRILVLDDILQHLAIQIAGSGMEVDVDEEQLRAFCEMYKVPFGKGWGRQDFYLPYNYLSSLGVDAIVYDYVWKRIERGHGASHRDENEICFVGKGIEKLNQLITGIWVDGNTYEATQRAEALQDIEARL